MVKNHLKRLNAPKSWKIERKASKFIARPNPGAHPMELSMPLSTLFKEKLSYADTTREVKLLMRSSEVLVDGRRRFDYRFPLGLMDVLSIPKLNEHYRMLLNTHGSLYLMKVPKDESALKLCRIDGKTVLKGGKLQLNLSGGRSLLLEKAPYKVGDTLLLELPEQKVKGHFPMEEGAAIYLIGGSHVGTLGILTEIRTKIVNFSQGGSKDETFTTSRKYAFVVGKGKPALSLIDKPEGDKK